MLHTGREREMLHTVEEKVEWKGSVLLQRPGFLDWTDKLSDLVGNKVEFQLVSVDIDPETGVGKRSEKSSIENWTWTTWGDHPFSLRFLVDKDFGLPGALLVENHHHKEFFLQLVTLLESGNTAEIHFPCNSWVYNHSQYNSPRIFFNNKAYLPHQTPSGLKDLRLSVLQQLRGDGTGERITPDRIYDYDLYNDLGNPDKDEQLARPVLGGSKECPYPRRCRTGRDRTKTDPASEKRPDSDVYVPRDEQFDPTKMSDFRGFSVKALAHAVIPAMKMLFQGTNFTSFREISDLYSKGLEFTTSTKEATQEENSGAAFEVMRVLTDPGTGDANLLTFPTPQIIQATEDGWMHDEELGRQKISGMNPMSIERLTVFPPVSSLDPKVYGPAISCITAEHIQGNLQGLTAQEALQQNRLYIVDYHDVYMPYLERINALEGKAYASRTIFFLTNEGTLTPVAIELSLPPSTEGMQCSRVFVPPPPGQKSWAWQLAKTHATMNDSGYHQLISHWLRTHACVEPFIIASNRQLSVLHPLYDLLRPHFKHTMFINALARKDLINCYDGSLLNGGLVEMGFTTGRYSAEMSAVVYKGWRFDEQGLPADLIKRGMAVKDAKSGKYGLRLLVEDYPFAVDGLDIWFAIQSWVREYLAIFYKDDKEVENDAELQAWWTEIKEVGHGDKREEEWWVAMRSLQELEEVVVTLIWVASAFHAAVNFGQYAYGGFMPNWPTAGRKLIPEESSDEYKELVRDPEAFFLASVSSRAQTLIAVAILENLSIHAANEEYLGQVSTTGVPYWTSDENVVAAFKRFSHRLGEIEKTIAERNGDPKLKNRRGPGHVAYTLLVPSSSYGLTGRGIPNSVSC